MILSCFLALPACAADTRYRATHEALFNADTRTVQARLHIEQGAGEVELFDFNAPADRYSNFAGDGRVRREGSRVLWEPPAKGGELRYEAMVTHQRGKRYDAVFKDSWALLRLDDVFPAARVVTRESERSTSFLSVEVPEGWSSITRYSEGDPLPEREDRRYTRPTGWMLAGDIGVRRFHLKMKTNRIVIDQRHAGHRTEAQVEICGRYTFGVD